MAIEFYNVKKKQKVSIDESNVKKTKYESAGKKTRYAFRAVDDDGTNLTKFCSESDWKALNAPEE